MPAAVCALKLKTTAQSPFLTKAGPRHRHRHPTAPRCSTPRLSIMSVTPTPEQIRYMQEHVHETLVPDIHISNGILAAASTVAVVLRFASRRVARSPVGRDDYCLLLAYVSTRWLLDRRVTRALAYFILCYPSDLSHSLLRGAGRDYPLRGGPPCHPPDRSEGLHGRKTQPHPSIKHADTRAKPG